VFGEVTNVKMFQNGNVSVFLRNGDKNLTIKNITSEEFDNLNNHKNKLIGIYNLRMEAREFIYSVTKTTMIYEHE
jgi:hypothetical protein